MAKMLKNMRAWSSIVACALATLTTGLAAAGDPPTPAAYWAFQPVRASPASVVHDTSWPRNDIDRFILAKLESAGVAPAADADRCVWLRRVSLDLTGLPPTAGQVSDFLADSSPDAFARVADRLLASRAFGERWARHWLDLVGYADQQGLDNNIFAEYAWKYRDYVIDALNADVPFDRFVRQQIAGDLLPANSAEERAANIVATGFLNLGDIAIIELDKIKLQADVIDQQVDKVGRTFLAMTIACARCHDHKIDPILQADYYGLGGIFQSTESFRPMGFTSWSAISTTDLPVTWAVEARYAAEAREHAEKLAGARAERDRLTRLKTDLAAIETSTDQELDDDLREAIKSDQRALNDRLVRVTQRIQHDEFFQPLLPRAHAVHDVARPADMHIMIRGNPHVPGNVAPRGFVRIIGPKAPAIPEGQSGRLQLADWLVDPANPLTARVTVNRVWQKLFAVGLVRSVDNFGRSGETPSNPELLDFLARRFVKRGWSQKRLIRELVLSHAYRMDSANNAAGVRIDPENRLFWRMNTCRLDAEALRDSLLFVSGKLIESTGGPALALEYPENSINLAPNSINPPGFKLAKYRPEQPFQRTIYLPIIRSGPQPGPAEVRNIFDFIQPAICAGQRNATSVPTQAMFLMNGTVVKERADDLADLLLNEPGENGPRLEQLWLRALGRPISAAERSDAVDFLKQVESAASRQPVEAAVKSAWRELCRAVLASNEFLIRL
ncbi:MAG TPA: DUF1549 and DUF1553 domain-containing protein [Tepidisphaeraceae bacterium]|jgi:hypothetical protein|nr:DUF1549 and DUF1553 domain-containing protein [Tepidisphaeraceae bacterium]